jgi:hypothetical protein
LAADLVSTLINTYVTVAKKIVKSGGVLKVRIQQNYMDLAKKIDANKVLPDNEKDLSNSLKFLKAVIRKQMKETELSKKNEEVAGVVNTEIAID